jgi:hypothetical protein
MAAVERPTLQLRAREEVIVVTLKVLAAQGTDRKGGRGGRWGQATAQTDGELELTVGHR